MVAGCHGYREEARTVEKVLLRSEKHLDIALTFHDKFFYIVLR